MKVRELIEALQAVDQELLVIVDDNTELFADITKVGVETLWVAPTSATSAPSNEEHQETFAVITIPEVRP